MIKVYILVFYASFSNSGGPAVIDNIATKEECQRISSAISLEARVSAKQCIEVWKVKP